MRGDSLNSETASIGGAMELWNDAEFPDQRVDPQRAQYLQALTSIYVYYAGTTAHISEPRMKGSMLCTTMCSAMVAGAATALVLGSGWVSSIAVLIISAIGILLTWSWRWMLGHYRDLNTAKFEVLGEIEKRLPARPLVTAEWPVFTEKRKKKGTFRVLTELEDAFVLVIRLLFVVLAVAALAKGIMLK